MRAFGWTLVVLGMVVFIGQLMLAGRMQEASDRAWVIHESAKLQGADTGAIMAALGRVNREIEENKRREQAGLPKLPHGPPVDIMPGLVLGVLMAAFGVLILAVRRPDRSRRREREQEPARRESREPEVPESERRKMDLR